jgi:hypothetical protein
MVEPGKGRHRDARLAVDATVTGAYLGGRKVSAAGSIESAQADPSIRGA